MSLISILIICGLTFGVCFLVDKGFTALFRGKRQHRTGLSVRVSRRYASFGLVLCVLGVAALFTGLSGNPALLIGGALVLLIGIGLIVYYMSFGIFYDEDTFLMTTFGKKTVAHHFREIREQQLYLIQGGSTVVELYLKDGSSVSIQSGMEGAYPFLDHAFAAWCRQTGRNPEDCDFHDPANSVWFPMKEDA